MQLYSPSGRIHQNFRTPAWPREYGIQCGRPAWVVERVAGPLCATHPTVHNPCVTHPLWCCNGRWTSSISAQQTRFGVQFPRFLLMEPVNPIVTSAAPATALPWIRIRPVGASRAGSPCQNYIITGIPLDSLCYPPFHAVFARSLENSHTRHVKRVLVCHRIHETHARQSCTHRPTLRGDIPASSGRRDAGSVTWAGPASR